MAIPHDNHRTRVSRRTFVAGVGTALVAVSLNTVTAAAASHTYKGPVVQTQWGPVQVSIAVAGKKITSVKVTSHATDPPSSAIQGHAFATLKQETLKAQSAKVQSVSGATGTSSAYVKSLKGALKKAHMK